MSTFAIGQRWISEPEPELGLGTVMETGGGRVQVLYPATSEVRVYTEENAPLRRVTFRVGESIEDHEGNSCTVESRVGDMVRVRMPSGALKELPVNCRATIGVLAGHGRDEMPMRTAGAAYYKAKARGKLYPHVSGVAMNPVDHPHGGGNHQAVHGPNSVARGTPPGTL